VTNRKRLSDIIANNTDLDTIRQGWTTTEAAADLAPVPDGRYVCLVLSGELFLSKKRTPGYKLTLEVTAGDYKGRKLWWDTWLTPAAIPLSKRDLAKIGVRDLAQLEGPMPAGILLSVKVVKRTGEDGVTEFNRVTLLEPVGFDKGDAFAPEPGELLPLPPLPIPPTPRPPPPAATAAPAVVASGKANCH
jgi:hypothetical protein